MNRMGRTVPHGRVGGGWRPASNRDAKVWDPPRDPSRQGGSDRETWGAGPGGRAGRPRFGNPARGLAKQGVTELEGQRGQRARAVPPGCWPRRPGGWAPKPRRALGTLSSPARGGRHGAGNRGSGSWVAWGWDFRPVPHSVCGGPSISTAILFVSSFMKHLSHRDNMRSPKMFLFNSRWRKTVLT